MEREKAVPSKMSSGAGLDRTVVTSAPRQTAEEASQSEVLRNLRENLIYGVFGPNARLKLEDLRERYSASASTVRESLLQLQSEGLVQLETNKGFSTAPVSKADLQDITELRVQFERQALRDAISRGDDEWEAEIAASLHLLLKTVDSEEGAQSPKWPGLHRRFHTSLVAACGSPWLLHFRSTLFDQAERYRSLGRKYRKSSRDIANEHKALAEAVLSRNADRACELGERHIRATFENIVRNVPGFGGAGETRS